jgi:hypothetical protein
VRVTRLFSDTYSPLSFDPAGLIYQGRYLFIVTSSNGATNTGQCGPGTAQRL